MLGYSAEHHFSPRADILAVTACQKRALKKLYYMYQEYERSDWYTEPDIKNCREFCR
jgi:hypothetical protein